MTAVAERFAVGSWVVVGENPTKAPLGLARIAALTENGKLIVEVRPGERHLVPPGCCVSHEGPPPGRELVPLAGAPEPSVLARPRTEAGAHAPPPDPASAATQRRWRMGERVRITRDQEDGHPAGTTGTIFGSAAITGYFQVKTATGIMVVIGEDLEPDTPHHAPVPAVASVTPDPEPVGVHVPAASASAAPPGPLTSGSPTPVSGRRKPRGPQSEAHRQAVRDGRARAKAARDVAQRQEAETADAGDADLPRRTLTDEHKRKLQEGKARAKAQRNEGPSQEELELAARLAQQRADKLTAAAEPERRRREEAMRANGTPALLPARAPADTLDEYDDLYDTVVEHIPDPDLSPMAPVSALRSGEQAAPEARRPPVPVIAAPAAAGESQIAGAGVDDALRLMVDTLEVVEKEVLRG